MWICRNFVQQNWLCFFKFYFANSNQLIASLLANKPLHGWLDSLVAKASDWWLSGCKLEPRLSSDNLGQVVHTHVPLTKQYNLVLADGRWCSLAGKVTAGLAESNGSLPPGGWHKATCRLTVCTPGSTPGPTLGNEYGKTLPLPLTQTTIIKYRKWTLIRCMWHCLEHPIFTLIRRRQVPLV